MVSNALAIVARQLQSARFSERDELDQLARLLGDGGGDGPMPEPTNALR